MNKNRSNWNQPNHIYSRVLHPVRVYSMAWPNAWGELLSLGSWGKPEGMRKVSRFLLFKMVQKHSGNPGWKLEQALEVLHMPLIRLCCNIKETLSNLEKHWSFKKWSHCNAISIMAAGSLFIQSDTYSSMWLTLLRVSR